MLSLTRTGLLLTLSTDAIPARGSSDVPVLFINDEDTYEGYLIQPLAGWYEKGQKRAVVCEYTNGRILIPAAAFQQNGEVMLAVALIDPEDANHVEVTHPITPCVVNAPHDPTELPDADTWQKAVCSLVTQLTEPIKAEAQEAVGIAESALQKADAALMVSGEAKKEVTDKIRELDEKVANGDFDGASILSGSEDPTDAIGKDDDLYINELTGRWFSKEDGAWADKGSLKGADGTGKVLVGSDVQSAVSETLLLKAQSSIEPADHISLAALLDAAGNASAASDTAIIKHEDQNLKDFINKRIYKAPEGYEITDNGIILLRGIDVGTIECTGWYYCVDCTGLPISESCYMEVKVHPTSTYHATQHFISATTGNEFKRNKSGGIWGRWLLTAGEVLLWSGSVQEVDSEINLLHDKDMFGTLAVTISGIKISASNSADLIPFVTLFNYRTDKTALIKTAIFTVVTSKKLILFSSSGQINFNYASNSDFVKLPVTAIYGRP